MVTVHAVSSHVHFDIPRDLVPEDAGVGSILDIRIARCAIMEQERRSDILKLQDDIQAYISDASIGVFALSSQPQSSNHSSTTVGVSGLGDRIYPIDSVSNVGTTLSLPPGAIVVGKGKDNDGGQEDEYGKTNTEYTNFPPIKEEERRGSS